ncbi:MAG: hypothetical protein LBQ47_01135 [Endomicrobium sp.]|jgi:hypothetical protein|nr:hypothetical protein [Endomicrobium sp.]
MFYTYKPVFLAVLYCMSALLYYFINKQLILTDIMAGPLIGSAVVFAVIAAVNFALALLISVVFRYCYFAWCKLFKIKPKRILLKAFWGAFTVLCYISAAVIFLKMTQY